MDGPFSPRSFPVGLKLSQPPLQLVFPGKGSLGSVCLEAAWLTLRQPDAFLPVSLASRRDWARLLQDSPVVKDTKRKSTSLPKPIFWQAFKGWEGSGVRPCSPHGGHGWKHSIIRQARDHVYSSHSVFPTTLQRRELLSLILEMRMNEH